MTAHDPRVTLTEAERDRLAGIIKWHGRCHADQPGGNYLSLAVENVEMYVEQIIAARLAPIRALADEWEAENEKPSKSRYVRWARRSHAYALRAALDAASAPVSASQDHDGAEGQGEGERRCQRVHNHPPYEPLCPERCVDGQLRGACLNDDGSPR